MIANRTLAIALYFIATILGVILFNQNVSAVSLSGTCYFKGGTCTIADAKEGVNDVFSGRNVVNGKITGDAMGSVYNAIATDPVAGKAALIQYILDRYNSADLRDKKGAAMIIDSVIGGPRYWMNLSPAALNRFKATMEQDSVTVDVATLGVCRSSFWTSDSNQNDIFWDNYKLDGSGSLCASGIRAHVEDLILVYYNGTLKGKFAKACGNPTEGPIGPIPSPAIVNPSASVDRTTAMPGETVTWTYKVTVASGPTSGDMQYYWVHSNSWSGFDSPPHKLGSGSATNYSDSYTEVSKTFTDADIGKTYCSATVVSRWGDAPYVGKTSSSACVKIGNTPSVCRPIETPIEAMTYAGMDNGRSGSERVYSNSYTPNYTAKTDVYTDLIEYTGSKIWSTTELTTLNTDGQKHTVTLTDITNHVVSMTVNGQTYYDSISKRTYSATYSAWTDSGPADETTDANKYAGQDTDTVRYVVSGPYAFGGTDYYSIQKQTRTVTGGTWSSWTVDTPVNSYNAPSKPADTATEQYRIDSRTVYKDTTVRYSDGNTRVVVSGLAPSSTTSVGATRTALKPEIGPCFDYLLNVSVGSFGANLEPGSTVSINPSATSDSFTRTNDSTFWTKYQTHSKSKDTHWEINQLIIDPGVALPPSETGGISNSLPCDYYDPAGSSSCSINTQGTTSFSISGTSSGSLATSYTIPDYPAGTKICFTFSILPDRSDPSNDTAVADSQFWYHAAFDPTNNCLLVVKKPKVQIWGGDLMVGKSFIGGGVVSSNVDTSQSIKSGVTFGSWVEYGIFASGTISGAGSGSSLAGGRPSSTSCQIASLTFANTGIGKSSCDGSTMGSYKFGTNIRDLGSYFNATQTISSGSIAIDDNLSGVYGNAAGSLTITGGTTSKSIVLNMPNTDVTISGDINYANVTVSSISQIPQVVIIARNIYISASVSNIDAWLVASNGKVNTCIEGGERNALTIFDCNNMLVINGPVVAKQLFLRRTAGSNPANESGDPAEIINLRSDAYLWMYGRSMGDNRIRSTYVTELPPRL